jgi:hypothetical protein
LVIKLHVLSISLSNEVSFILEKSSLQAGTGVNVDPGFNAAPEHASASFPGVELLVKWIASICYLTLNSTNLLFWGWTTPIKKIKN